MESDHILTQPERESQGIGEESSEKRGGQKPKTGFRFSRLSSEVKTNTTLLHMLWIALFLLHIILCIRRCI